MPPSASPAQPDRGRAERGSERRLRGVTGGYDLQRWPLAVAPAPDEHPVSWLWRVANRYGLSPAATLTALGIPRTPTAARGIEQHLRAHGALLFYRLGLHPFVRERHAPAGPVLLDMELERYVRTYRIGRIPFPTFGYCPQCLAETGAWSGSWLSRLPGICPTHHVTLARTCPGCGAAPFSTVSWLSVTTPPWVCPRITGNQPAPRRHRNRCGADLRATTAQPPTDSQARTLARLLDLAAGAATAPETSTSVVGFATSPRDHLDAVFELIDELVGIKAALSAQPPPDLSFLEAAGTALSVLEAPDAHDAAARAERHGLLDPGGVHTPLVTGHKLRLRAHNPLLAAIRLSSLADSLSPTAQLTFRTASRTPRYPAAYPATALEDYPRSWPGQTQLGWVPQVIWPGVLTPWIDDQDIPARATASMLLAKVGSTRPWSLIALDLGLPAAFAATPRTLTSRMRRTGHWTSFLAALDDLATRLEDDPPPIDYSARRWAACTPGHMNAAIGQARLIYGECDISDDRNLARMTWQLYTGGHGHFFAGPDTPHPHAEEIEPSALAHRITRFTATTLHHLAGQPDHGPLAWRPP